MQQLKKYLIPLFVCFGTLIACQPALAAKLTIVIDDVGYSSHYDREILAMPKQIAVAIIPIAPYAKQRAQEATQQQRDILIHLPMQPMNKAILVEKGALKVGMTAQQVEEIVTEAHQKIPYAIGMNNHMGSAATKDRALMNKLMDNLKAQKLFFLDSKTIGSSVAAQIAKQHGISTLTRHFFLDDSNNYADVKQQFKRAVRYAQKQGQAIVIGHPRQHTVAVLKQELANLPKDIQLVSIGSLWRHEKVVPPKPFILLFNDVPAPTSAMPFQYNPLLRGVPE